MAGNGQDWLLTLPIQFCKTGVMTEWLISTSSLSRLFSLTINGRFKDDAILSTTDKTYSIRQVSQSNSLLLCSTTKAKIDNLDSSTGDQDDEEESALQLNTTLTSTLELLLVPPKLERISNLLKWSLYQGQEEEERRLRDQKKEEEDLERLPKRRRIEIKVSNKYRLDQCSIGWSWNGSEKTWCYSSLRMTYFYDRFLELESRAYLLTPSLSIPSSIPSHSYPLLSGKS